jgi:hypothetical protein
MGFWNKSVWWIAGFVALACLFALARTAETGSGAIVSGSGSGTGYYSVRSEGPSGSNYGNRVDGEMPTSDRLPSDQ